MQKKIKSKKSQAWGIDLTIGFTIFFAGVVLLYLYSVNSSSETEATEQLNYDGNIIAESLLSAGSPDDWNSGNVNKIGIAYANIINETKLERFYSLANSDYQKTKELFNTRYDYLFSLSVNMTINSQVTEQIGKPGASPENINTKNLVKITRFVFYKNKPSTMYLYVWET